MNLFELTQGYKELLAQADKYASEHDGEISETFLDLLTRAEMDLKDKVNNTLAYIKNLEAEAEALEEHAKSMIERAKAKKNKIESTKDWLKFNLEGKEWDSVYGKISYRKSESVVLNGAVSLEDIAIVHPELIRETKKIDLDKTACKALLKEGVNIAGIEIEKKVNMVIK